MNRLPTAAEKNAAKALYASKLGPNIEATYGWSLEKLWDHLGQVSQDIYLAEVRVVIRSLRDPTPEMRGNRRLVGNYVWSMFISERENLERQAKHHALELASFIDAASPAEPEAPICGELEDGA